MKRKWKLITLITLFSLLNCCIPYSFLNSFESNRIFQMLYKASNHLLSLQTESGAFIPSELVAYYNTYIYIHSYVFDALLDAQDASIKISPDVIIKAQNYLLKMRYMDCWNFTLHIPCDTDDSAIATLTLLRSGIKEENISKSIEKLNSSITSEGYSKLWITNNDTVYMYFVENNSYSNYYGNVYDSIILTAGTVYDLFIYNYSIYKNVIDKGIIILENSQEGNGAWLSKYWYPGVFYGIFLYTRLIALNKPNSNALLKTYEFLLNNQHSDGGWGRNESSNPLDTSLALISLHYLNLVGFMCKFTVLKGINYLFHEQYNNGTFLEVPLWTSAPYSYYQGKILTTVFAVKALALYTTDINDNYLSGVFLQIFIICLIALTCIEYSNYFWEKNYPHYYLKEKFRQWKIIYEIRTRLLKYRKSE